MHASICLRWHINLFLSTPHPPRKSNTAASPASPTKGRGKNKNLGILQGEGRYPGKPLTANRNMFEPIAIIGKACLLPGALNPEQLWQNTLAGKNCLSRATAKLWRANPHSLLTKDLNQALDKVVTDQCGYVKGFDTVFNPYDLAVSAEYILRQDMLCQWLVHTGREALKDAGHHSLQSTGIRAGAIVGNLCYPSAELTDYTEAICLLEPPNNIFKNSTALQSPQHRFNSGFPVHFMAQALSLTSISYAIDAACASSLYAIKLACDQLHAEQADLMLAGGINLADSLFLSLGFTALKALSPTGQSRPLHCQADGLIPSQGVGLLVLRRLADAIKDQDTIQGVIRGIGLTNDGNGQGFLTPSQKGQMSAMQQAYDVSGIDPKDISWVECHATGTVLGDTTEITSMAHIYQGAENISIGALKANIGHTITASGAAAVINSLSALKAELKPPTLYASDNPTEALLDTPFQLLRTPKQWLANQPRIAAVNCFGFGGNNAHLLLESWSAPKHALAAQPQEFCCNDILETIELPVLGLKFAKRTKSSESEEIAIVGVGILMAATVGCAEFMQALFSSKVLLRPYAEGLMGGYMEKITLGLTDMRFPPADLYHHTRGQQLAILKAAQEAYSQIKPISGKKTGVWVGMQCDAEVGRYGLPAHLSELFPHADMAWLKQARAVLQKPLEAAGVIGSMPNIVTNRLNRLFDFTAPSFSVLAEEASGMIALQMGMQALIKKEIDTAMVGAVDLSCDIVHRAAACNRLPAERQIPADAAAVVLLKRKTDAIADGDVIYALVATEPRIRKRSHNGQMSSLCWTIDDSPITHRFGHAHAASGLIHVIGAALACHEKKLPTKEHVAIPWLSAKDNQRSATISLIPYGSHLPITVTVKEN